MNINMNINTTNTEQTLKTLQSNLNTFLFNMEGLYKTSPPELQPIYQSILKLADDLNLKGTLTTKYNKALKFFQSYADLYNCSLCEYQDTCLSDPQYSRCREIYEHSLIAVEALKILCTLSETLD